MALELVYEGLLNGLKNVAASELTGSTEIVPGRICCLSTVAGEVVCGDMAGPGTTTDQLTPFGLVYDYKEDTVGSGKVSVFLDGMFLTDQYDGTINKGDILTFDDDGKFVATSDAAGDFIVAICTEADNGNGFIEIKLNISGAKS